MKNKVLFLLIFFLCLLNLSTKINAQDIIKKTDGSIIKAKVLEINSTEIKYKRFDYLTGPTVTLSVSEISHIKYPNGMIEKFNAQNTNSSPNQNNANTAQTSSIDPNGFTNKEDAKNRTINGLKQGKWIEYRNSKYKPTTIDSAQYYILTFYKDDKPEAVQRIYYNSGKLYSETPFSNGKKNGVVKSFYENGQLWTESSYSDDILNGMSKSFDKSGRLSSEMPFTNDKINGIYKSYDANGQLQTEITYRDDKRNGVYKSYYEGELVTEGIYKDDQKNGIQKSYYNGKISREVNYVDGVAIDTKVY
jgi:antitoxin component YwqK of YwqJK toxin-antitoxin module